MAIREKNIETYVSQYGGGPGDIQPLAVDFETRLMLASTAMDVLHERAAGNALTEAHDAVDEALTSVPEADTEVPAFQPHPVLKAAGDLIRKEGWVTGVFGHPGFGYCAIGAIRTAIYGNQWMAVRSLDNAAENSAVDELMRRIAAEVGHDSLSVAMWNDRQTDKEAVLRLLY